MALSNLWNQPKKELTESIIGLVIIAPVLYFIHRLAWAMSALPGSNPMPYLEALAAVTVMLAVAIAVVVGFLVFTHWLGETIIAWVRGKL